MNKISPDIYIKCVLSLLLFMEVLVIHSRGGGRGGVPVHNKEICTYPHVPYLAQTRRMSDNKK